MIRILYGALGIFVISFKVFALDLTVMYTNDHHGHFWKDSKGQIGMAARKTLIDHIRRQVESKGGESLLLSGGDINTGFPHSNIFKAKPDFLGMNLLGYDAMAVGNHEFDNSREVLLHQEKLANFPFLSANIYQDKLCNDQGECRQIKTPFRLFRPYIILNKQDVKIGIFGLTTTDTPYKTSLENTQDLKFTNEVDEAKMIVAQLKRQDVDVIIAVTHMGHYPDGKHGSNALGDVTLAREVNGIDLIVGGHTQKPLFKPDIVNSTIIVQAHEWGKYVGRLDLSIDNISKKITVKNAKLIPVNLKKSIEDEKGKKSYVHIDKEIEENQQMLNLLEPFYLEAQDKLSERIGSLDETLIGERSVIRSRQTRLGTFVAESASFALRAQKVDLVLINSGGIRSSLPAGEITYASLLKVHPFGNTLTTFKMLGNELKSYLAKIYAIEAGNGGFAQTNRFDQSNIENDKEYTICVTAYSATGGDKWPNISSQPSFSDSGITLDYAMKSFVLSRDGKIIANQFKKEQR